MIEKAIYSFWSSPVFENNNGTSMGFKDTKTFLYGAKLSVELARKHFKKIEFHTDLKGAKLFCDDTNIFRQDEVILTLEDFSFEDVLIKDIPSRLWAYGKLAVFSVQKEPFVHIDFDAFIFNFNKNILSSPYVIQHREEFSHYYQPYVQNFVDNIDFTSINLDKRSLVNKNINFNIAYNYGVVGGTDYLTFTNNIKKVLKVINHNIPFIQDTKIENTRMCTFFEQYLHPFLQNKKHKASFFYPFSLEVHKLKKNLGFIHIIGPQNKLADGVFSFIRNNTNKSNLIEKYKNIDIKDVL